MNIRNPAVVSLAISLLLSACAGTAVTVKPLPVSVGSSFSLPSLLEIPEDDRDPGHAQRWLGQRWYAGVQVTVGVQRQLVILESCTDYLAAPTPIHLVHNQEIAAFSILAVNCLVAELIAIGKASRQSFIEARLVDENLPQRMPSMLAMVTSVSEWGRVEPGRKWSEVNADVSFTAMGANEGRFTHGGGVQELTEMARGDFTGDGLEDVLLNSFDRVQGGSYAARRLFLISRESSEHPFKVTQLYPR